MPKVVIFSSHSHVLPFVITEHIVADAVFKYGETPIFLRPNQCTCSSIHYENEDKKQFAECGQCIANEVFLKENNPKYLYQRLDNIPSSENLSVIQKSILNSTSIITWTMMVIDEDDHYKAPEMFD